MIRRRSLPLAIAAAILGIARARPAEARPQAFVPLPGGRSLRVHLPSAKDLAACVEAAADRSNAALRRSVALRGPLRWTDRLLAECGVTGRAPGGEA